VIVADDRYAVRNEVCRQLESFRRLVGRDPTHLDSHQHVHRVEPVRSVLLEAARELGVSVRHFSATIQYCGRFYGQTSTGDPAPEAITADALITLLRDLPPGFSELGCHPGLDHDMASMYRSERLQELQVLCDARVREALDREGIELRSFHGLNRSRVDWH